MKDRILNAVCVALGFAALGVGCIGIVLPFLPTTPLFLAALVLFAKGSERFHRWFMGTKLYHRYLKDFVTTRSMTKRAKIRVLTLVTLLLLAGFYFSPPAARIVIALVLILHDCYFLFGIKTVPEERGFSCD